MKKYVFGADIGGTTVKIGLFETSGELLEVWEIPTRTENNGVNILPDITEAINNKLKEKNISKLDVEGVGMGVPGPVGTDGTVLKCVNLGWGIFNVEDEMTRLIGLKAKVGNDANVAALGEMWQGGGRGYEDIVMVTLGTGVGGGVIIGGHILNGINGAAGEFGHMTMRHDETDICGCGKKGCLEQYTSANGIVRVTKRYLAENPDVVTSLKDQDEITSKLIFDEAKKGDKIACLMVDGVGDMLGHGLSSVAMVVNPQAFVIGGGVSRAGNILIETIEKHYREYAFHASRDTVFKLAELGNNAGIYGAVRLVLE